MYEEMAARRRAGEALAERVIGLTEASAEALAGTAGLPFRVVKRDGQTWPLRADLRPGRLNATVEQGTVTAVRVEREPGG